MADVLCCEFIAFALADIRDSGSSDACITLVSIQELILGLEESKELGQCSESVSNSLLSALKIAESDLQDFCSSPIIPEITIGFYGNTPLNVYTANCGKVGAKAVFNDGGVMLWGNVCWPTKQPGISYIQHGDKGFDIQVQLEYSTEYGRFLGPMLSLSDCKTGEPVLVEQLCVDYQGGAESGVVIWIKDGGVYKFYEKINRGRIKGGRYISSKSSQKTESALTFDKQSYDETFINDVDLAQEVTCICEPNVILMSDTNRPWSITFDQIKLTNDKEVRAISAARIAEDESVASYNTYAFTERAVYVFRRDGRSTALELVSGSFGLELDQLNDALIEVTKYGVAFQGTDGRLHFMTGREIVDLDATVRPKTVSKDCYLWNTVKDIEYDIHNEELYVLTDTGVWVYNFEYKGWIANYDFVDTYGSNPIALYYQTNDAIWSTKSSNNNSTEVLVSKAKHNMIFLFPNGLAEINDETESDVYLPNPYITTQPIFEGVEKSYPKMLRVDYEKLDNDTLVLVNHWLNYTTNEKGCGDEDTPLQSYEIPPGRPRYPKAKGRGHVIKLSNFKELRELGVLVTEVRGNN